MQYKSRRSFVKSMLILSLTGFNSVVISACRKDQSRKSSDSNLTNRLLEPSYLRLYKGGELKKRGEWLWSVMKNCKLCPRECGANRLEGEEGFCHASSRLIISSYNPHFGEERPLVGRRGSGTIFFTHCNLRCVFCINWEISQGGEGVETSLEELADMMMYLQKIGCHNINVVTPTHYSPHIVLALGIAARKGLRLPLVYNTCGWEKLDIIRILDGIVDIYLPDLKYSDREMAAKYSSDAKTYPEVTKAAILEMQKQVGVAKPAEDGLMYRGLMIRHLVMPNNVGGSREIMQWIANNLPKDTYVNIMSQYRPMFKAFDYPEISRRITREEYSGVVKYAEDLGLTNLDIQG